MSFDTIAGIATPLGEGGVGMIRISGPGACSILKKVAHLSNPVSSHRAYHGRVFLSQNVSRETFCDEVVYIYYKGPKSYTGEDMVEVCCHGGVAILKAVLDEILFLGARMADRGEFTKRAFLNNKIDLIQAESVLSIIKAKTTLLAQHASYQLSGHFSRKINLVYQKILNIIAALEAENDFPDDAAKVNSSTVVSDLKHIVFELEQLLTTADIGRMLREGVGTVILGAPNVGKSTLLNSLLGEDRAIVSSRPGTTRDVIEETVNIGGMTLNLSDTAGICDSSCEIEREGVDRAKAALDRSELILFVVDASRKPSRSALALLKQGGQRKIIVVLNKIDLVRTRAQKESVARAIRAIVPGLPMVETCLIQGRGLEKLKKSILSAFFSQKLRLEPGTVLLNSRHKECVQRAKERLQSAIKTIKIGMHLDLASIDLTEAAAVLAEMSGRAVSAQVIDAIFSQFCVGK